MPVSPGELSSRLRRRHVLHVEKIERGGKTCAISAAFAMEEQRPRRGLQYPLKRHDVGVGQFALRRKRQIDMGKVKGLRAADLFVIPSFARMRSAQVDDRPYSIIAHITGEIVSVRLCSSIDLVSDDRMKISG